MSLPDICGRKHGGSPTSVAANKSVHPFKPRQRDSILGFIAFMGSYGATSKELTQALKMGYTSVSARLAELKEDGLIRENDETREDAAVVVATGVNPAIEPDEEATQKPSTRATLNLFSEATGLQST